MMRKYAKYLVGIFAMVLLVTGSAQAKVNVYAEGVYTDSDLVVSIYVDVDVDPILSYGVKLIYDPAEVNSPSVVKDKNVWYFGGPGDEALETPNAIPDTSTLGEVVIVGGKIDKTAPTEGVFGDRKPIAVVSFDRVNPEIVPTIGLELGKGGSYANFVTTSGIVMDGTQVSFLSAVITPECSLIGDLDGDKSVGMLDYNIFLNHWGWYGQPGDNIADLDNDGSVGMLDYNIFVSHWGEYCK